MDKINQTASIILPNQLFEKSPLFSKKNKFFLIEEFLFFNQYKFHKQKLFFHRLSMKKYQVFMKSIGFDVEYIDSISELSDIRSLIKKISFEYDSLRIINPIDYLIERRVKFLCEKLDLNLTILETPMFISTHDEFNFFKTEKKKFFQTSFYKLQRKKLNILIDDQGKPEGGDWTYDSMNRERYPIDKKAPQIKFFDYESSLSFDSKNYVEKNYSKNPGEIDKNFSFPTDFEQSMKWFKDFLNNRFNDFGIYEDSIVDKESFLNHFK